jgi:predicted O-methyltransferase YrrM
MLDDRVRAVLQRLEREDAAARKKLEPGALVIADNVISHPETLGAYVEARQSDPTLESVTVPLDRGLELSAILEGDLSAD